MFELKLEEIYKKYSSSSNFYVKQLWTKATISKELNTLFPRKIIHALIEKEEGCSWSIAEIISFAITELYKNTKLGACRKSSISQLEEELHEERIKKTYDVTRPFYRITDILEIDIVIQTINNEILFLESLKVLSVDDLYSYFYEGSFQWVDSLPYSTNLLYSEIMDGKAPNPFQWAEAFETLTSLNRESFIAIEMLMCDGLFENYSESAVSLVLTNGQEIDQKFLNIKNNRPIECQSNVVDSPTYKATDCTFQYDDRSKSYTIRHNGKKIGTYSDDSSIKYKFIKLFTHLQNHVISEDAREHTSKDERIHTKVNTYFKNKFSIEGLIGRRDKSYIFNATLKHTDSTAYLMADYNDDMKY